jgi:hypothetical protein
VNEIATAFSDNGNDILYADLNYLKQNGSVFYVNGSQGGTRFILIKDGCRRTLPFIVNGNLYELFGNYDPDFGTAADYELMLRFHSCEIKRQFFILKR